MLHVNLFIPTPVGWSLGKWVSCSTLLEMLTVASGTSFQPGGATLSGNSFDTEGGVTALAQHCIQANDCLLARLISLSAAES